MFYTFKIDPFIKGRALYWKKLDDIYPQMLCAKFG